MFAVLFYMQPLPHPIHLLNVLQTKKFLQKFYIGLQWKEDSKNIVNNCIKLKPPLRLISI